MTGSFPDYKPEKGQSEENWAKAYIDAIINYHDNSSSSRRTKIQNLYDTHNGIVKQEDKRFLVERYGSTLSASYVDFKLGRTKIKLLLGEYITIDFDPFVYTTNPDALTSKAEFASLIRGAMSARETLDKITKSSSIKPLNGIKIPKETDPDLFNKLYPKTENEVIMQTILDDELADGLLKLKGYETMGDVVIVSECHGLIEKDNTGKEIIEVINPKSAIFQEVPNDPFCEKSPFKGHWKYMFVKDILQRFKLSEADIITLKSEEEDTSARETSGWKIIGGVPAVPVYFLEWKSVLPVYTKRSPAPDGGPDYIVDIDPKFYNKHKVSITNDIAKKAYTVEESWREVIYEGVRIGKTVYAEIGLKKNQIQTRDFMNKYRAEFDYVNFLFGTIDGIRISLQELVNGLSAVYNIIMFQMVREIRKIRGKVFVYDEAMRNKLKTMKSVLYDLEEHGVLRVNSSSEQNYGAADVTNAVNMIKELDLGLSQSFQILLQLKITIEDTIDRITGINENREGLGKASQTATGAMQNIEASRSITKDIFYCHNLFMQECLRKLLEKRKTNWEWIDSMKGRILLGKTMAAHLKITRNITNDDYGVYLSDGKKEKEIREMIRPLFAQEINASKLRTKDVVSFEMSRNLNAGIQILEIAWDEINKIAARDSQIKDKMNQDSLNMQRQMAIEDREDQQAHEVLIQKLKSADASRKLGAQGLMNESKLEVERKQVEESNTNLKV